MLLVRFEVTDPRSPLKGIMFEGLGEVTIEKDSEGNRYPEFEDITLMQLEDGVYKEYLPEGSNWYGQKYTGKDIVQSVFSNCVIMSDSHCIHYWHPELEALIADYTSDVALTVFGKAIPKKVLSPANDCYELSHVTEQFIYYSYEDLILMLSAETHMVLSDNCFAENAWFEDMEHVLEGKEKLLYGEMPKKEWFDF